MPFLQDMQVPDPDIMPKGEGVQVDEVRLHEGLVNYQYGLRRSSLHACTILDGLR